MRLFFIAIAVSILGAAAGPAGAGQSFGAFRTQSGAIGCVYDVSYLRCDVAGGVRPLPPRPKDCMLDWGQGFEMARKGNVTVVCAGDTAIGGPLVVLSATSWHRPGFLCISEARGLRCKNADGRGFFISAKAQSLRF
jgi:hypothetical protein